MIQRRSRRDCLKRSALVATGLCAGPRRVWAASTLPASETVGVAVIGVAGQGLWNIQQLLKTDAAIVALCDVDERRSGEARALCPKARFFVDFREMLNKAGRDFEAVLVATPDHTHAVATIAALQAGKHVYCEKPLAHSVWETRQVMTAARKYQRITQIGIQIHAGRNYRRVVELIRAGTIGPVREVHAWCPTVWSGGQRPPSSPVPPGLNWDLWLGPAPERPYADRAYVPAAWRGWWDFGGGGCADMGCHFLDLAYWALDLGHPATIEAQGPPVDAESAPEWLKVRYEYRAQGSRAASIPAGAPGPMPPVTLTWTVGRKGPPAEFKEKVPDWKEGVLFIGDEGMLLADFNRFKLLPASRVGSAHRWAEPTLPAAHAGGIPMAIGTPQGSGAGGIPMAIGTPQGSGAGGTPAPQWAEPTLPDAPSAAAASVPHSIPKSIGHHREFIEACKGNGTTSCPFDYAGVLTQAVLLGNVAYRAGRRIEWNPDTMTIPNAPEAERYLRRPYRKGWELASLESEPTGGACRGGAWRWWGGAGG